MAKLYLVCGLSGCGKSTFARRLAEDEHLLRFTPDDFYALVNGNECIRDNQFEAWNAMFLAIHAAERNRKDCVVDTNALTPGQREQFLDWFPGFEHHLIYIEASDELREKNNAMRRRVVPDEVMARMKRELKPVTHGEDERWMSVSYWINENNTFLLRWRQERGEEL